MEEGLWADCCLPVIGEAGPHTSDIGVGKKVPFLSIGKNQNVEAFLPLAVGAPYTAQDKPSIAHSPLAGAALTLSQVTCSPRKSPETPGMGLCQGSGAHPWPWGFGDGTCHLGCLESSFTFQPPLCCSFLLITRAMQTL